MLQFKTLIFDTLKREYKNKFLYFLTFLSVIVLIGFNFGLDLFLKSFKEGVPIVVIGRTALQTYFYFINSWSFILAIVLGAQVIRTDFTTGVVDQILSFNIDRKTYLFSRLLGGWLIVFIYYLFFFVIATITISSHYQVFNFTLV